MLESFVKDTEQLEVKIRTAAVPEMDCFNERVAMNRPRWTLAATNLELVGEVSIPRQAISNLSDAQTIRSNGPQIFKGTQIDAVWRRQEEILYGLVFFLIR